MTLSVEVVSHDAALGDVVAIGIPVIAGDDGPVLPYGLEPTIAGVELPQSLDADWCRRQGYTAKPGQVLVIRGAHGAALVLVGLGPASGMNAERWRRGAAGFVRNAGEGGTAALVLPGHSSFDDIDIGSAVAEGAVLGAYRFDELKSSPRGRPIDRLLLVARRGEDQGVVALAQSTRLGTKIADAVSFARDLINTPPSHLTPRVLAERVGARLAATPQVTVDIWDEGRIASERLGGLLGVSRGSAEPPRLVQASYQPTDPATIDGRVPHVVLVGKGITFDSGGLSLKTADGMTTMKTDMSGAAVVLACLGACADLGIRTRVTAIAPIAENMPGGRAIKPGDVLTIRNGATIEVLNTDAEGRLVLADGLSLAAELEPDAIVDVATLTGAVTVALGRSIAGLFGNDATLIERVRLAGIRAGESLWPMPLAEEYGDHLDSDVADMKNVGKPGQAGSIVAALLLARFVGEIPWAHLDIAGTGRATETSGYLSKGGTGFGVRTLLELLRSFGSGPES